MTNLFKFENRDGLEQLKEVESESVRLVLTDPPYLIAHIGPGGGKYKHFDTTESFTLSDLQSFVKEWYRVLTPGGTLICWFDVFKFEALKQMCEDAGFGGRFRVITWMKDTGNHLEVKKTYMGWTEWGLVVSKPPAAQIVFNNEDETGKCIPHRGYFESRTPRGKVRFHPTQKPVDMFEELVSLHTNPGDTVLDSFTGSGATPMACLLTGRNFIGAELNKEYFDKTRERLNKADDTDKSQSSMVYVPNFNSLPKQS